MTFIETDHPRDLRGQFAEKPLAPAEAQLPSPSDVAIPDNVAEVYKFDQDFHRQHGIMHGAARERAFAKAVKEKFGVTTARYFQLLMRHPEYRAAVDALSDSGVTRPTSTQTRAALYGLPVQPEPFRTQRVLDGMAEQFEDRWEAEGHDGESA